MRKVGRSVILEPIGGAFDWDTWFAELDAGGGPDFLPGGLPDDAPVEPDKRRFFSD